MARFVKSTVGAIASKGTFRGLTRFEITADDEKGTRTITAVSGNNLQALKNVTPVTITEDEWKASPSDAYDELVEWVWLAEKVGMTTAITR